MIIRINIHVFIKSGDVIKLVQLLAFMVPIHCDDVTNIIFFFLCGFGKKLIHNVTKHEMAKKLKMNGYVQDHSKGYFDTDEEEERTTLSSRCKRQEDRRKNITLNMLFIYLIV